MSASTTTTSITPTALPSPLSTWASVAARSFHIQWTLTNGVSEPLPLSLLPELRALLEGEIASHVIRLNTFSDRLADTTTAINAHIGAGLALPPGSNLRREILKGDYDAVLGALQQMRQDLTGVERAISAFPQRNEGGLGRMSEGDETEGGDAAMAENEWEEDRDINLD